MNKDVNEVVLTCAVRMVTSSQITTDYYRVYIITTTQEKEQASAATYQGIKVHK